MSADTKEFQMATLMIRSMDERVKSELRVLAARRGVSMEQQARDILERAVLGAVSDEPFAQRIARRFASIAVDSLPVPVRQFPRPLPAQPKLKAR
jgi:antitoxin FitA